MKFNEKVEYTTSRTSGTFILEILKESWKLQIKPRCAINTLHSIFTTATKIQNPYLYPYLNNKYVIWIESSTQTFPDT